MPGTPVPRYRRGRLAGGPSRPSWRKQLASPQAVYQRLFEWVVNRINSVMEARGRDPRRDGKDTVIGVLDIYGFEVFPVNRWVALPSQSMLCPSTCRATSVPGSSAGLGSEMASVSPNWSVTPRLMPPACLCSATTAHVPSP